MTKNKKAACIALGAVLVLYNLLFFVLPAQKSVGFWISYGFGMVAILAQLGVCLLAWGSATTIKSKFLGLPILIVGYTYLLVQLLLSGVFLVLAVAHVPLSGYGVLILDALLFCGFVVLLCAAFISKQVVVHIQTDLDSQVNALYSLSADINELSGQVTDQNLKIQLTNLAEKFRYSDPVGNQSVVALQEQIAHAAKQLHESVLLHDYHQAEDLIGQLCTDLDRRNQLVKLQK